MNNINEGVIELMKKEIEDGINKLERKTTTLPEVKEKRLVKSSGKHFIALNPNWLEQWGLNKGDSIVIWLDLESFESNCLFAIKWTRDIEELFSKNISADLFEVKKLKEMGNSLYVHIPIDWLDKLDAKAKDSFGVYSNGILSAMKYGDRDKRKIHDALHKVVMGVSD